MQKNKLIKILGIYVLILLVLPLTFASQSNYETSTVSRIAGNSVSELSQQLNERTINMNATIVADTKYKLLPGIVGSLDSNILKPTFNDRIRATQGTVSSTDFNIYPGGDFVLYKGDKEIDDIEKAPVGINTNDLRAELVKNNTLLYLDSDFTGLYLPNNNLYIKKLLPHTPIIAPTYTRSSLLASVFACNLGNFPTLSETYRNARNNYYLYGSNEFLGLTLLSFDLLGNPLTKLKVPSYKKENLPKFCDNYVTNDTITQASYFTNDYSVEAENSYYYKNIEHTIDNYAIVNDANLSLIEIDGYYQQQVPYEFILPTKTFISEFPLKTVITGIKEVTFGDPIDLVLPNISALVDNTAKQTCYQEQQNASIVSSHTYTHDSEQVYVSVNPVEVVNCTTGRIKLYKKIKYKIEYLPYSPVLIEEVNLSKDVAPSTQQQLQVRLRNLVQTGINGKLVLKDEQGNVITSKTISKTDTTIIGSTNITAVHDLAITSFTFPNRVDVNSQITLAVTIKNEGNVADSSVLRLYQNGVAVASQSVELLAPNESVTKTFIGMAPDYEVMNIELRAQLDNLAGENDTIDNKYTKFINVHGTHDISTDSISLDLSPDKQSIYLFDNIKISSNITNRGNVNESVVPLMFKDINYGLTIQNLNINNLKIAETRTVNFTWIPSTKNYHTVKITAILTGDINSTNNEKSNVVKVLSIKDGLTFGFVTDTDFPPNNASKNTSFYVWVYIQNNLVDKYYNLNLTLNTDGLTVGSNQDGNTNNWIVYNPLSTYDSTSFWWIVNSGSVPSTKVINVSMGFGTDKIFLARTINIS